MVEALFGPLYQSEKSWEAGVLWTRWWPQCLWGKDGQSEWTTQLVWVDNLPEISGFSTITCTNQAKHFKTIQDFITFKNFNKIIADCFQTTSSFIFLEQISMNFTKPALFGYTCTLLACIVKPYCFLTNKIIKHANVANICLCSKIPSPSSFSPCVLAIFKDVSPFNRSHLSKMFGLKEVTH